MLKTGLRSVALWVAAMVCVAGAGAMWMARGKAAESRTQHSDFAFEGRVIPETYFGMTVLDFRRLHPSMNFGTVRSWDAGPGMSWAEMNPARDEYDFSRMDEWLHFAEESKAEAIYTFGRTPRWASSQPNHPDASYGPGQCAPPADMKDWDNYVSAVVTHAAGRVRAWEMWNEPNEASYCGDVKPLAVMAQRARQIIKSIDAKAVILSPSTDKATGPSWLAAFLAAGGSSAVDAIAFHGYWSARAEDVVTVVNGYRDVADAAGLRTMPLWDTETSWAYTSTMNLPPAEEQMAFVAKTLLLHWSMGVERVVWYAYDGGVPWGTMYRQGSGESDAAAAFRAASGWMRGSRMTEPCAADGKGVWACTLVRDDGRVDHVVWSETAAADWKTPEGSSDVVDLLGHRMPAGRRVRVGRQPVLVQGSLP